VLTKTQNEGKVKRAEFEARWTKITEEETIVKGQRQLVRDEQVCHLILLIARFLLTNELQAKLNNAIAEAQRLLSGSTLDTSELPTHESELEAKRQQLETMKQTAKEASYDTKLADLARKMKDLEKRRDDIYEEQKALAGQSEARASLNIKRQEIMKQNKELETLYVHRSRATLCPLMLEAACKLQTTSTSTSLGVHHCLRPWSARSSVCGGKRI